MRNKILFLAVLLFVSYSFLMKAGAHTIIKSAGVYRTSQDSIPHATDSMKITPIQQKNLLSSKGIQVDQRLVLVYRYWPFIVWK
ncbi:hypothetical protein [Ferruginibacter albus]|uniref:hypothetical protein n=1 Tax=Ferruginibacter albus TaxID=2875540 RepID=UPI001CC3AF38|nr:hypothetical protein [Ferruginibacter albus]UAY53498.1 hypothetical protein K9M53_07435 [Ferruginibacter albus]